jgi:hypothetical protein
MDGKPVFLIFDPKGLPNAREFVRTWQRLSIEAGLPGLYIIAWIQGKGGFVRYRRHEADGFDAGLYVNLPVRRNLGTLTRELLQASSERLGPGRYQTRESPPRPFLSLKGSVHSCVWPNWDNTPRSARKGMVVVDSSPELFEQQLRRALMKEVCSDHEFKLVVIKSWNEWAEGNHIEPDAKYGRQWLEAVKRAREMVGLESS